MNDTQEFVELEEALELDVDTSGQEPTINEIEASILSDITATGGDIETRATKAELSRLPPEGQTLAVVSAVIQRGETANTFGDKLGTKTSMSVTFALLGDLNNTGTAEAPKYTELSTTFNISPTAHPSSMESQIFNNLNRKGTARNMFELLRSVHLIEIVHRVNAKGDVRAYLRDKAKPIMAKDPVIVDLATRVRTPIHVNTAGVNFRVFKYEPSLQSDKHYLAAWDTIFLKGVSKSGMSLNFNQLDVSKSNGWENSRLCALLRKRGSEADLEFERNASSS